MLAVIITYNAMCKTTLQVSTPRSRNGTQSPARGPTLSWQCPPTVITVPATFNDEERKAAVKDAQCEGLDVLQVIHESTAVAISCAEERFFSIGKSIPTEYYKINTAI